MIKFYRYMYCNIQWFKVFGLMSFGEDYKFIFIIYIVVKSWESEYCISEVSFSCGF